jgi:UDP-N-acetylglucosamine transferase subunit ALG13
MTKTQSDGALESTQPFFLPSATLRIFITVGSTRFDALIASTALGKSFLQAVSRAIPDGGQVHCIAQYGNSDIATILASSSLLEQDHSDPTSVSMSTSTSGKLRFSLGRSQRSNNVVTPFKSGNTLEATQAGGEGSGQVDISLFSFARDLKKYMEAADIVISHAGE